MNSTDSLPDSWNSNWKLKKWKINYMIFVTNMHVLLKYDQIVCIILQTIVQTKLNFYVLVLDLDIFRSD